METSGELPLLLVLAAILTSGLIGGELFARARLPHVTGWILTGVALRLARLELLAPSRLHELGPFLDFTLGYIAFTVGSQLKVRQLRNSARRLGLLVVTEFTVTPLVVFVFLHLAGVPWEVALLLTPVAVAGAPATTLSVVGEARAAGVYTRTLLASVALIDMVAICLFETWHWSLLEGMGMREVVLIVPLLARTCEVLVSGALVGLLAALATLLVDTTLVDREHLGITLLAAIVSTWGIASSLGVSSILACTFLGVVVSNTLSDPDAVGRDYLDTFRQLLFIVFFTLAGLHLDLGLLGHSALAVLLLVLGRTMGKVLSSWIAMSLAKATPNVRRYLGLGLLPHGGIAIGLLVAVQGSDALPEATRGAVLSIGLAAIALDELVGPLLCRLALERIGEAGQDRERLLGFLQEPTIATDFTARSSRHAIDQLVDLVASSDRIDQGRQEILDAVLRREAERSSYLGGGLMVPRCLDIGRGPILGAMGIAREGLAFDTPDGLPIHFVVLLVVPREAAHLHLPVLGSLARSLAVEGELRKRLLEARTPAHAHEALHHPATADLNEYLDELAAHELRRDRAWNGRPPRLTTDPGGTPALGWVRRKE